MGWDVLYDVHIWPAKWKQALDILQSVDENDPSPVTVYRLVEEAPSWRIVWRQRQALLQAFHDLVERYLVRTVGRCGLETVDP